MTGLEILAAAFVVSWLVSVRVGKLLARRFGDDR